MPGPATAAGHGTEIRPPITPITMITTNPMITMITTITGVFATNPPITPNPPNAMIAMITGVFATNPPVAGARRRACLTAALAGGSIPAAGPDTRPDPQYDAGHDGLPLTGPSACRG
jgi:hypothetical protein